MAFRNQLIEEEGSASSKSICTQLFSTFCIAQNYNSSTCHSLLVEPFCHPSLSQFGNADRLSISFCRPRGFYLLSERALLGRFSAVSITIAGMSSRAMDLFDRSQWRQGWQTMSQKSSMAEQSLISIVYSKCTWQFWRRGLFCWRNKHKKRLVTEQAFESGFSRLFIEMLDFADKKQGLRIAEYIENTYVSCCKPLSWSEIQTWQKKNDDVQKTLRFVLLWKLLLGMGKFSPESKKSRFLGSLNSNERSAQSINL